MTDEIIKQQIERGSRVIDLGCGDGHLLATLRDEHDCSVMGIELDRDRFASVIGLGVPVIRADLDEGLSDVPDESFDCAVLKQTLQQLRRPAEMLNEMMRIARRALVLVPNFGHWRVRMAVLRKGRAPVVDRLERRWYNSPNIHFMSMRDFHDLVRRMNLRIVQERPIINGRAVDRALLPNLRADSAFYVLERG